MRMGTTSRWATAATIPHMVVFSRSVRPHWNSMEWSGSCVALPGTPGPCTVDEQRGEDADEVEQEIALVGPAVRDHVLRDLGREREPAAEQKRRGAGQPERDAGAVEQHDPEQRREEE